MLIYDSEIQKPDVVRLENRSSRTLYCSTSQSEASTISGYPLGALCSMDLLHPEKIGKLYTNRPFKLEYKVLQINGYDYLSIRLFDADE